MYIQIKPIYKLLRFYINKKNSIFGYVYRCINYLKFQAK